MNYYETLYLVHSALEAGRLKDTILSVEKLLKENGGKILTTEVWGKKKLSYPIEKQRYGTYILVQFTSDGSKNNNFNLEMEHNPSILSYISVKIDEAGLREQTEDLDTQIAGKEAKPGTNSKPIEKESEEVLINEGDKKEEDVDIQTLPNQELLEDENKKKNDLESSDDATQKERKSKTDTPETSKQEKDNLGDESEDEKATEKVEE